MDEWTVQEGYCPHHQIHSQCCLSLEPQLLSPHSHYSLPVQAQSYQQLTCSNANVVSEKKMSFQKLNVWNIRAVQMYLFLLLMCPCKKSNLCMKSFSSQDNTSTPGAPDLDWFICLDKWTYLSLILFHSFAATSSENQKICFFRSISLTV